MALQRNTFGPYVGRWSTPTAGQPQGAFKNRTSPGAGDGSFLEEAWANDWSGFFSSLLDAAGVSANNLVDEVGASQYFDALTTLIGSSTGVQTGDIIHSADTGMGVSRGFLELKGLTVTNNADRTTRADLFSTIGTTYGIGDGSTTFGLPRFPAEVPANTNIIPDFNSGITLGMAPPDGINGIWIADNNDVYVTTFGLGTQRSVSLGAFAVFGPPAVAAQGGSITGNNVNGDIWIGDLSGGDRRVLKSVALAQFTEVGDWNTDTGNGTPADMSLHENTGDLWVADDSNDKVRLLAGGAGTYTLTGSYPGASCTNIAVHQDTGDVYAAGGGEIYRKAFLDTTFRLFSIEASTVFSGLSINERTGDIWYINSTDQTVHVYLEGKLPSLQVGTYPDGNPTDISLSPGSDSVASTMWVSDNTGAGNVYQSPAVSVPSKRWIKF